jgi:hypothetical protein
MLERPVTGTTTIQANSWSAGIYFVLTSINDVQVVEKVMKR